jgi:surfeit locus 1 family protein
MVALGVWQLGRADEKAALIAHYEAVSANAGRVDWPTDAEEEAERLYRLSLVNCVEVVARRTSAASSSEGAKGLAQIASCRLADGSEADIALGFTRDPIEGDWQGGEVQGIIAPGPRLVAIPPQAGLQPLAAPDPRDLPNNHLAYAGQWFFFALTALVIFALAIRKRIKP